MKKFLYSLIVSLVCSTAAFAANGDTTYLKVFDKYPMNYVGNHDAKGLAPASSKKSQRIWMKYTIGCTASGQCEWDYTIKLMVRQHTGKNDSTLKQAPSFKVVNGTAKDTVVYYSTDTTYTNVFNSTTKKTDSIPSTLIRIAMFGDSIHPLVCTDTLKVWPTNFYRYSYDTTGKKTDSALVAIKNTLHVKYTQYYSVFEVVNDMEMGRMISPYAKNFPKNFQYEHLYDVTDFASLLHDSVEIRINYGGYSWGFTSTIEFYFIEGTPAREATSMDVIYNNYYNYGQATSIEVALSKKKFTMPADAASAKLRLLITGHGGETNENCAEFCAKYYYINLNNKLLASELVWKDDCGSNAIINQGGTWIYDRANWCPGEKIKLIEYPLNIVPGSTDSIDMDMDPFTASGGAGYHITAYVVYYKSNTRTLDAGIEDIITPSKNFWYSRSNPICDNAQIMLRNWGTQALTSAEISYQMGNASVVKYNWTGNLAFEAQTEVVLPYMTWPSDLSQNTFKVWVSKVNGQDISADQNATNNMLTSQTDIPQAIPPAFIIETTTNSKPEDNGYTIKDASNKIIFTKTFTKANSLHRDTFNLGLGCYTLELTDNAGNGLSFWGNSDGAGSIRVRNAAPPVTVYKTFNPDFGNFLRFNFTILYKVGMEEQVLKTLNETVVYPSPAADMLHIETSASLSEVILSDLSNRMIYQSNQIVEEGIPVNNVPSGIYLLQLTDSNGNKVVKKISVAH